ncbi:ALK and LTK ligand 2-like [Hypomesus transpacificus]|uniref:ALK and LTK ligand 2-like n=1 Tax=Hypomesus transpacificus TaxID=137520 RepID=UPI001F083DC4|nr:ALK and LTK ligand 2-like [Hypomesus transpacificus]
MSGQPKFVIMGLVLLICTTTLQWAESTPAATAPTEARDDKSLLRQIVDIVKHVEDRRGERSAETASQSTSRKESPGEPRESRNHKSESGDQIIEIFPRDLRKKEKFLKHLTGPLYFSPKCRKHVYRLYHNTRDCTIPAYFKRCARLLTRLAGSPRCTEG